MTPEEIKSLQGLRDIHSAAIKAIDEMIGAAPSSTSTSTDPPPDAQASQQHANVVDLSLYPGANDTERAIAAYRATVPGAEKLEYDTVFPLACEAKRTGKFVNLAAQRQQRTGSPGVRMGADGQVYRNA